MQYHMIVNDVRDRIISETKAKLSARRQYLETVIGRADDEMNRLDNQRLEHFLIKSCAAAELRDLTSAEVALHAQTAAA